MPRTYIPRSQTGNKKTYDGKTLENAVVKIRKGMSYRKASLKFGIPTTVLHRHVKCEVKKQGGQCILSEELETEFVDKIITCADWGYPLSELDVRCFVKHHLDRCGRTVKKFRNNLPGTDWAKHFMKRHKEKISPRVAQNIKRNRAAVRSEDIVKYFDNLRNTIADVPPHLIVNYDETNLCDDPGKKKILCRRGCKYPERIMNSSKSSTSVVFAATADGTVLPPYVIYKAQHLYDTWTNGGPKGTRFNRTQSGWMDAATFLDWILTICIPYFRQFDGKKVLIGDNLSSHLSPEVVKQCEDNNIAFVFLPPNSTHLCQPLDVAVFRALKQAWRSVLEMWKLGVGSTKSSVDKQYFPILLRQVCVKLHEDGKFGDNVQSGFRKTGIFPLDPKKVLSKLPGSVCATDEDDNDNPAINDSLTDFLRTKRYGNCDPQSANRPQRKKRLQVSPGKSIRTADFQEPSEDFDLNAYANEAVEPSTSAQDMLTQSHSQSVCLSVSTSQHKQQTGQRVVPGRRLRAPHIQDSNENGGDCLSVDVSTDRLAVAISEENTLNLSKSTDFDLTSYVVVNFGQKCKKLFIGQITQVISPGKTYEATFMRESAKVKGVFLFPDVDDKSVFDIEQVICELPHPKLLRRGRMKFDVDLSVM